MSDSLPRTCAHCDSNHLYTQDITAGGHMPLLHGLGGFLRFPTIDVVLCAACGHIMLFADQAARKKVASGRTRWRRLAGGSSHASDRADESQDSHRDDC